MPSWFPHPSQIVEFRRDNQKWAVGKFLSSSLRDGEVFCKVRTLGENSVSIVPLTDVRIVRKATA